MNQAKPAVRNHWKSIFLKILSPVILAILLFNVLIFAIIIPEMKENIIEKKKEMLKELTQAELSEISNLYQQEKSGKLDRQTAQEMALSRLKTIRYGDENKDYFWVSDRQPKMIMHPYLPNLDGQDLSNYKDPRGKRLFVEFANVVKEKGEGRVDYLWQWKDDPKKIVPKVSFVKWFEPWDWIVGTGIYIEDVQTEVDRMTRKVINISLGISFLVALLLLYMTRISLTINRQRSRAQAALRESEEKYRTLIESHTEGILLAVDGRPVYSNKALLELLDYSSAEFNQLTLEDIILSETRLKNKEGDFIEVTMSQTPVVIGGRDGSLISIKDLSTTRKTPEALVKLLSELHASLLMSNTSIRSTEIKLVECGLDTSIQQAAWMMCQKDVGAIIVKSHSGEPIGIVTDRDLRNRVMVPLNAPSGSVATIMSSPLMKIDENALMFEAALLMQEKHIKHLVVTGEGNRTVGVLALNDVIQAQRHPASILLKNIEGANSVDELQGVRDNVNGLISALLENGARVDSAGRILSTMTDATICRVIELGFAQLGPAPTPFAFIVLGSVARKEQTLTTDQDNGIIFSPTDAVSESEAFDYFIRLGQFICDELDRIGFDKCKGNVMASNPKWCRPLAQWEQYFSDCISSQTPQDLLDFNVFFDFRYVYGDRMLLSSLRKHIQTVSTDQTAFFFNLAEHTLQFKPPIGFFGNLQLESSEQHRPAFNIKSAITPIVNFARIYALKNHIDECNTLERLARLQGLGVIQKSSYNEIVQGYSFLMQIRLMNQATKLTAGQAPNNFVDLKNLTQLELSTIKRIFADIMVFQAKLRNDFARTA